VSFVVVCKTEQIQTVHNLFTAVPTACHVRLPIVVGAALQLLLGLAVYNV